VVSRLDRVPITSIKEEESAKLLRIEEELHSGIISQDKPLSLWPAPSAAAARGSRARTGLLALSCSWSYRRG